MTIKDIAQISGYGVSTVSRALNGHPDISEDARKKIESVIQEYRFTPNANARQLKQSAGKNILIIVNGTSNMLFSLIVEQMQAAIDAKGHNAVFHYIDERAGALTAARKLILEQKPLGVIFLGGNSERFKKGFSGITAPCVICTADARPLGFSNLASVCVDDHEAGRRAVDCLYERGHRKIGFISGTTIGSYAAQNRLGGAEEAMREHKLEFDDSLFAQSRFALDAGYSAGVELVRRHPDLTAIFAAADIMAIGAMRAIIDLGYSVPGDISLIGFDGIPMTQYLNPKLTTFRQPQERLAELSVEFLMELMRGGAASHALLTAELLEGGSVRTL